MTYEITHFLKIYFCRKFKDKMKKMIFSNGDAEARRH